MLRGMNTTERIRRHLIGAGIGGASAAAALVCRFSLMSRAFDRMQQALGDRRAPPGPAGDIVCGLDPPRFTTLA